METQDTPFRVYTFFAMSLDGFIATRDHKMDWLEPFSADGEDYGYADLLAKVQALVLGRNTYEFIRPHPWGYGTRKVYVRTHRPLEALHGEIPVSGPLTNVLESLRKEGVTGVYLDGGQVIHDALNERIVTDLIVSVVPILLGSGIPVFGTNSRRQHLQLKSTSSFPSGLTQLHFATTRS